MAFLFPLTIIHFMKTLFFALMSFNLNASIIKHDVSSPKLDEFEYKEFCSEMGVKEALLITPKSEQEVECLNKTFKVTEFCEKKFLLDKTLTRGFVDKVKKKIICERSESVMLSVACDKKDLTYCFAPKKGCLELKKLYAHRLEWAHYSMLERNINCYFAKPIGESFNEN